MLMFQKPKLQNGEIIERGMELFSQISFKLENVSPVFLKLSYRVNSTQADS